MDSVMFEDLVEKLALGAIEDEQVLADITDYARDSVYELYRYMMALEDGYRARLLALQRKDCEIRILRSAIDALEQRMQSMRSRLEWLSTVQQEEYEDAAEYEAPSAAERSSAEQIRAFPTDVDGSAAAESSTSAAREERYREILDSVDAGSRSQKGTEGRAYKHGPEVRTAKNCKGCIYAGDVSGGTMCGYWAATGRLRTVDENGNKRNPLDTDGNCLFRETKGKKSSHGPSLQKKPGRGKAPSWDVETGKTLYESGMRTEEIASKLNTSTATIQKYAYKHHWTRPKKGGT